MPLTPENQADYLAVIQEAARQAGKIQMKNLGTTLTRHTKHSGIDLVTNVDYACDGAIRDLIRQHFPDDHILTEETFEEGQDIDLASTWVVDPLDGTTNYTHGFPYFAVSIAYFKDNDPKLGVVLYPSMDELYLAVRGEGASLNGEAIRVSQTGEWQQSLIATGFPYDVTKNRNNGYLDYFQKILSRAQGLRRPGAAALDLAYLACGRLDGFWEFRLSPWDVAAGGLLIEEAGGIVTDFEGNPLNYAQRRINIMGAGSARLHQAMLGVFSKARAAAGSG